MIVDTAVGVQCVNAGLSSTSNFLNVRAFSTTLDAETNNYSFTGMAFNSFRTCVVLLCRSSDPVAGCSVRVNWRVRIAPPPRPPPSSASDEGGGLSDTIVGAIVAGAVSTLCGGVYAFYKYRCTRQDAPAAKAPKSAWEVHEGSGAAGGAVATPNPLQAAGEPGKGGGAAAAGAGAGAAAGPAGEAAQGLAVEHGVEMVTLAGGAAKGAGSEEGEEGGYSSVAGGAGKAVGKFVGGFIKGLFSA